MFVRFVFQQLNPDTGVSDGIFDTAYQLRDSGKLPEYEEQELSALLCWFGDYLDVPARFNRTKSKGYYRRTTKGISWFKSTAKEQISNMRRLAGILGENGHDVTMIKAGNPGYIVCEDEHQVVAEPFSDTPGI